MASEKVEWHAEAILEKLTNLKDRMYDVNGDIPAIREHLETINTHLDNHSKRLVILEESDKMNKWVHRGLWFVLVALALATGVARFLGVL